MGLVPRRTSGGGDGEGGTGPRGPQGPQGIPGPAGIDGQDGAQGPIGPAGADGAEGLRGPQGDRGPQGPQGEQGPAGGGDGGGAQGPPGPEGPEGPQGPEGPRGAQGDRGPAGAAGAQGAAGINGSDGQAGQDGAQGPQGDPGPAGQDGQNGLNGAQGPAGPAGQDGADGAIGPQGPQGLAGADGAAGPQGPAGAAGQDGAAGPAGQNGDDGEDGAQGPQGVQGTHGLNGAEVEFFEARRTTIQTIAGSSQANCQFTTVSADETTTEPIRSDDSNNAIIRLMGGYKYLIEYSRSLFSASIQSEIRLNTTPNNNGSPTTIATIINGSATDASRNMTTAYAIVDLRDISTVRYLYIRNQNFSGSSSNLLVQLLKIIGVKPADDGTGLTQVALEGLLHNTLTVSNATGQERVSLNPIHQLRFWSDYLLQSPNANTLNIIKGNSTRASFLETEKLLLLNQIRYGIPSFNSPYAFPSDTPANAAVRSSGVMSIINGRPIIQTVDDTFDLSRPSHTAAKLSQVAAESTKNYNVSANTGVLFADPDQAFRDNADFRFLSNGIRTRFNGRVNLQCNIIFMQEATTSGTPTLQARSKMILSLWRDRGATESLLLEIPTGYARTYEEPFIAALFDPVECQADDTFFLRVRKVENSQINSLEAIRTLQGSLLYAERTL